MRVSKGVPDLTALCSYQTIESSRCLRKVCPTRTRDRSTTAERERKIFFNFGRSNDHIAASVSCCVVDWGYQGAARSARDSPKKSPKKAPVS